MYFGTHNQPFTTQDATLAYCLWAADIPFWDDRFPCIHRYNAGILNHLGYSGLPLEEAANKAFAAKKRGNVQYLFKWPKELRNLVNAFHDEEKQIATLQGRGGRRNVEIMQLNISPEERAIRSACLVCKMKPGFIQLWQTVIPRLRIGGPGKPQTVGNVTSYGGWKDIPLNASRELKEKMGLS